MQPNTPLAQAGQLLAVGFESCSPPADLLRRIQDGEAGAVVLLGRNVESPEQLAELCGALQAAAPPQAPLLVTVDQEGGRVRRLRDPWPSWPAAAVLGTCDDDLIARVGRAMGDELRSCGIHLNLAPVLDVHTNPDNPVIGDRAYGTTPAAVIRAARAHAKGLGRAGLAACGKHFPGHGDTSLDSHTDRPVVRHPRERLERVEQVPFAALALELPALMTAHVVYEALDPERPATLSPTIVQGILRDRLGFRGLVLSDDLEMQAVAGLASPAALAVQAVEAGVDLLLVCHRADRQQHALEGLVRRAEQDTGFAERLAAAAHRVARFKRAHCQGRDTPDPRAAAELARDPTHHELAARAAGLDPPG